MALYIFIFALGDKVILKEIAEMVGKHSGKYFPDLDELILSCYELILYPKANTLFPEELMFAIKNLPKREPFVFLDKWNFFFTCMKFLICKCCK